MVTYLAPFVRLQISGILRNVETWTVTLSVASDGGPPIQPTQEQADGVRDAFIQTYLRPTSGSAGVLGSGCALSYVKAARIGTDGKYQDAEPTISTAPTSGNNGSAASVLPPQIALAITLLGPSPRGAAGRGRFYLPDIAVPPDTTGRLPDASAVQIADLSADFINRVNALFSGRVSIVGSNTATGRAPAVQPVTSVRVGRVYDTIRSRRSSMPEEPRLATVGITDGA